MKYKDLRDFIRQLEAGGELKRIQVEELTPMEAINKLYELKRLAAEEEQ